MTRATKLLDAWSAHPWTDAVVGVGIAALYAVGRATGMDALVVLGPTARGTLYTATAGVAAGILAFAVTPMAIILALSPGPRLRALLKFHGDEVRRALMTLLWSVLGLLATSLAGLAIDTGNSSARWFRYVVLVFAVMTLVATARLVHEFGQLLRNIDRDNASEVRPLRPVDDGRQVS